MVSFRVGQVTRRNSDTISPTNLKLSALRVAPAPSRRGMPMLRAKGYLTSLCRTWARHLGQYFFNSRRCVSLRRFLEDEYVRSLQSTQPRVINMRFAALRAMTLSERLRLYLITFVITPEPTVRPPSRTANRSCSSIATGVISLTFMSMLSPGITISTPSGNSISPVTSVVRM
jgi:hypothetical protein